MSNLGSIGSQDLEQAAAAGETQSPLVQGDDPHAQAALLVHQLFQSPKASDHVVAMQTVLALMSKGHNCVEFAPFVVQQVAAQDAVSRQLAYVFLSHYAEEEPETIILSVNSFQRSLTDSDPLVRASAVRVLSSIRNKEVLPVVADAVNQVIGDPSPYVKKAAAYAMIKACELEPNERQGYLPLIGRLLGDPSPIAFSGAIAAYWNLCPDNIDLLHPHFHSICHNIGKLDEWAQILTLRALTSYSRYCFRNPDLVEDEEDATKFWDEELEKEALSGDHLLLIHAAKSLLSSLNAGVVMAAVSLLFYTAPSTHISSVARPLVRLLYESPVIAQVALSTILTVASVHCHIFVPHLNHFFVRKADSSSVKQLKLKVLALLASPSNAEFVLNELSNYTGSVDVEFAATAVKTMGKTALCNEVIIPQCLVSLLNLIARAEGPVLSEVVLVIAQILQKKRGTDDEAQALRILCRKFLIIHDPAARSAVLSIVGDLHETHPEFAPQLLRYIANNFMQEPGKVRLQALILAAKLIACGTDSQVPMYVLKIGERDTEYDVRDRARFLLALVKNTSEEIHGNLKSFLFPPRKAPQWTDAGACSEFQIGTFSHYFNRAVGVYEPLPDWADESELPDESVRQSEGNAITGEPEEPVDFEDWITRGAGEYEEEEHYYSDYSYSYSEEEQAPEVDQGNFFD